jgi:hypothetical protein
MGAEERILFNSCKVESASSVQTNMPEAADEAANNGHAACESLSILQASWFGDVEDGLDFFRVDFDAVMRYAEAK